MGDEEEDDNQDIGVQNEEGEKKEGEEGADNQEGGEAQKGDRQYNKDYKGKGGYKKNWKKGQHLEDKKNMAPAVPRQKNEKGDYIVTSFTIPDKKSIKKEE